MNRFWEPLILGVLAEAEEGRYPLYKSVFINSSNELQFSIRILSTPPHSFPNSQRTITCWGSDLVEHGFEDEFFDRDQRIKSLIDFLNGKLLVFQIEKKVNPRDEYYSAKNIQLIPMKPSFVEGSSFMPVPLFLESKDMGTADDFTWEQFINNLKEGRYIGRNEQVSREPEDTPRFIIFKTLDNEYYAVGEFESHHYAHGGFSFVPEDQNLKFAQLDKKIVNEIYTYQNTMFVGMDEDHQIIKALQEDSSVRLPHLQPEPEQVIVPAKKTNAQSTVKKEEVPVSTIEVEVSSRLDEEAFMEQFIAETKKMNLVYKVEDLYNFHTCVKTGGLTILAGMSGTGKSQLINAYQKGLHLDSDKFLMIPVSPTWTDDTDLIGYPDIVNNVYRPAETGLVNLLIEAEKNRNETFIVCFDEMNLAKVEHYFSQFLSVLEMEKGRRKLKLYNRDLQSKFYNGSFYPPEILIGDNVIFTGTVNLDESTHQFSDKVLDRSNLITLHVEPFIQFLTMESQVNDKVEKKVSYSVQSFVHQDRKMVLTERELEFLWEVHTALMEVSATMGIGPRIVKQIDTYIKNLGNLAESPIDRKMAFDLQFVQRVMSKIRGSEEMLRSLIGETGKDNTGVVNSRLSAIYDEYSDLSDFNKSRAVLLEKAKGLMRNGYTI
ncbi:McrB family protein [Sporosarcina contaminans]|uniref:McrB family protein n=1 Tax=Sporosarcina contaminans TaxID=633403 RepID=A0ABW3TZM5_9BACL